MSGDPANFPEPGSTSSAAKQNSSAKKATRMRLLWFRHWSYPLDVGLNPCGLHI